MEGFQKSKEWQCLKAAFIIEFPGKPLKILYPFEVLCDGVQACSLQEVVLYKELGIAESIVSSSERKDCQNSEQSWKKFSSSKPRENGRTWRKPTYSLYHAATLIQN